MPFDPSAVGLPEIDGVHVGHAAAAAATAATAAAAAAAVVDESPDFLSCRTKLLKPQVQNPKP